MSAIIDRYINFYNNPDRYHLKTKLHKRGKAKLEKKMSIEAVNVGLEINEDTSGLAEPYLEVEGGTDSPYTSLVLRRLLKFETIERLPEQPKGRKRREGQSNNKRTGVGSLDFGMMIEIKREVVGGSWEGREKYRYEF